MLNNNVNSTLMFEGRQVTSVEDFFEFLNKNPRAGTFSYAYYSAPVKINKNLEGRGKNAIKNPMFSEELNHSIIFKCNWYKFNYAESYSKRMLQLNPNYQFSDRETSLTQNPDFKFVESGSDGDYFNIMPKETGSSVYAVYDISHGKDGLKDVNNYRIVTDFEEIKPFFPNTNRTATPFDFRKLMVSRTFELAADANLFQNPEFRYVYFGNKPNR